VTDAEARDSDRIRAIEALPLEGPEGEANIETLRSIVWKRSAAADVRIAAINALVAHEPDQTGPSLALLLPTETDWAVIGRVCDLAIEYDWKPMTPSLVRSWARPTNEPTDDDRPERAALLALHPGQTDVEIVFNVFVQADGEGLFGDKERSGAWSVLMRRVEGSSDSLVALLEDVDLGDVRPDVNALARGARTLGVVPDSGEQLETLTLLFEESQADFLAGATTAVAGLSAEQRLGLVLRHVPIVLWASIDSPELLRANRQALLNAVNERLRGRPHHARNVSGDTVFAMERLHEWEDDLVWADLLSILVADDIVQRPAVAASLFAQADIDKSDSSTEHGGAIVADWNVVSSDSDVQAVAYLPRATQRRSDTEFVASTALLRDAPDALFHYHFHAQRYRNREYAGPSEGDLLYANRFGRACLAFTFTSRDELAVDYYQPGGARIDLGVLSRRAGE
jgi:hypothetical protein